MSQKTMSNDHPFQQATRRVRDAVASLSAADADGSIDVSDMTLEVPADRTHGDLATSVCLKLATQQGVAPRELALSLAQAMEDDELFASVEVAGPGFVNLRFSDAVLQGLLQDPGAYLADDQLLAGTQYLVEFFQLNTAKPTHVGHLRSMIIAPAVRGLLEAHGASVVTDTHFGDWGVQFGILLNAFLRLSEQERDTMLASEDAVEQLNTLYVRENARIKDEPAVREQGKETFAQLEAGDPLLEGYWKQFVQTSEKTYPPMLEWLDIQPFTVMRGESAYKDQLASELEEALQHGAIQEGEAIYFDLEDVQLGRCYLQKSDGSSTYHLRDVAALRFRQETWDLHGALYVVDTAQSHHLAQLYEVAKRMGIPLAKTAEHIANGRSRLPEGAFSTRKGNIIRAQKLFNELDERAFRVLQEKNPELAASEHGRETAHQVAQAALKWWDLSHDRKNDITFEWERVLSFEGNTGPYMQYTVARLHSVLRKVGTVESAHDQGNRYLLSKRSEKLARSLLSFQSVMRSATESREPHQLASYLFELAQSVNQWYAHEPVVQEEDASLQQGRIAVIRATLTVLKYGLSTLTIPTPEAM